MYFRQIFEHVSKESEQNLEVNEHEGMHPNDVNNYYMVCPKCKYKEGVHDLDEKNHCPECGTVMKPEDLEYAKKHGYVNEDKRGHYMSQIPLKQSYLTSKFNNGDKMYNSPEDLLELSVILPNGKYGYIKDVSKEVDEDGFPISVIVTSGEEDGIGMGKEVKADTLIAPREVRVATVDLNDEAVRKRITGLVVAGKSDEEILNDLFDPSQYESSPENQQQVKNFVADIRSTMPAKEDPSKILFNQIKNKAIELAKANNISVDYYLKHLESTFDSKVYDEITDEELLDDIKFFNEESKKSEEPINPEDNKEVDWSEVDLEESLKRLEGRPNLYLKNQKMWFERKIKELQGDLKSYQQANDKDQIESIKNQLEKNQKTLDFINEKREGFKKQLMEKYPNSPKIMMFLGENWDSFLDAQDAIDQLVKKFEISLEEAKQHIESAIEVFGNIESVYNYANESKVKEKHLYKCTNCGEMYEISEEDGKNICPKCKTPQSQGDNFLMAQQKYFKDKKIKEGYGANKEEPIYYHMNPEDEELDRETRFVIRGDAGKKNGEDRVWVRQVDKEGNYVGDLKSVSKVYRTDLIPVKESIDPASDFHFIKGQLEWLVSNWENIAERDNALINLKRRLEAIVNAMNESKINEDKYETIKTIVKIIKKIHKVDARGDREYSDEQIAEDIYKIFGLTESKLQEDEGLTGNNATVVPPIPQDVNQVPEEPVVPEQEKPAVEPKEKAGPVKEYLGNNGSTDYFYLVTVVGNEGNISELQITDANEQVIYTTKDSTLNVNDIAGFIQSAIKEKEIANISTDIMNKYLFPEEKPETVVAEEEEGEKVKTPEVEEIEKPANAMATGTQGNESINKLMEKYKLNEVTLEEDFLFDEVILICRDFLVPNRLSLKEIEDVLDDVKHQLHIEMKESIDILLEKYELNEGTWKFDKVVAKYALKDLEEFKRKYFETVGDDEIWDGIDNAKIRIEELLSFNESKIENLLEKYKLNEEFIAGEGPTSSDKLEQPKEEVSVEEPKNNEVEEKPKNDAEVPSVTEEGAEVPVDIPTTPEEAKTKIQLEYPEEPFTSLALAFADSFIDDPKIYNSIRQLQYEGVWTKVDEFIKMAKAVGELNNFNGSETAEILSDKFKGDSAKYRIGRDNVVVVDIVVRDMSAQYSLEAIKDLVGASSVEDKGEGNVRIKW